MAKSINNNKIVINKNCLSNRSNFNSSCSLGGVKNNNLSHKNCITNKFVTRNRDITSCYNCRPNTILNLSKNKTNSLITKINKFSSVDNNIYNNNSEIPLIKIKTKNMCGNSLKINQNRILSTRDKNTDKIYSLKNNLIYNKVRTNIGLNSNMVSNPFYVEEDNKLSERQKIKVNIKRHNQNSISNSKFPKKIYLSTTNNKIDIINNININSNNSIQNYSISKESSKELNKHKIADILNGKFSSNDFSKKSRNIDSSNDLFSNVFNSNGNITTVNNKKFDYNNNSTTSKLERLYRSLGNNNDINNIDIKITYHKKPAKKLKIGKKSNTNYLESKIKSKININKKKVIPKNIITHRNIDYVVEENKNNNLNSYRNNGINGIVRTKYSNIYLRKKSDGKDNKNGLKDINKKNNRVNINYKSSKQHGGIQSSFLRNTKLIIKK